ncbi:MAG: Holliday junction branch migration protein RuvA [Bacteroidales bacterium]|nr:Holliday junction branch migration protein RuvA [Bacteroidales bacterium]MCI2122423.1 Holliday junction branch migration protein RuvA [Bacteroidales bacterium]MCI2145008.1 Holliday junction branch migration protein RuvA [Bacteroidales bacterium]
MYDYVKGTLVELNPTEAVVETCGVGYSMMISLQSFSSLGKADHANVKLYVHHTVNQQSGEEVFYGFYSKEERALFELLISVSGVGPGSARMMLSGMSAEEMREAIVGNDVRRLQSVKGIGAKTAQRIVLELKDKIIRGTGENPNVVDGNLQAENAVREEAASALINLGFSKPNVDKVIGTLSREYPDCTLEELIKKALKIL